MPRKNTTVADFSTPRSGPQEKRPCLIVVTERDFGQHYFLARGETVIGRDDDCLIRQGESGFSAPVGSGPNRWYCK